jgi:hypothetical protein
MHFVKAKEINPNYGPAEQLGLSYYMKGIPDLLWRNGRNEANA